MEKGKINVQDQVLNIARKEGTLLEISLISGEKFKGQIQSFDGYCVLLRVVPGDKEVMVYKHAISTITSEKNIALERRKLKEEKE